MDKTKEKSKAPTLYTVSDELQTALDNCYVDEDTGEMIGFDELEAVKEAFDTKAAAVAVAIRGAEAYAEALKEYKIDIEKRQKAAENKVAGLRDYLAAQMERAGVKRIDRVEARVTLTESESVEVVDEQLVPMEYKKIDWKISKSSIKKAINSGRKVDGARIVSKKGVLIK